ncbi:hypothetical protein VFPFJ_03867 [Purpureocillium lilacinum]|uniref:Uncharacterized protein n=1 Tax=Purpureocillium lilacinum TaxID=33203 RepID=A0A179HP70_PURLI|nr:hypothetical protein VFPFJ_03867 [Purpureocillium lilacinum]OAQ92127.1 hypothetical protein VFPFJ_03867 [Purpureocillium lilacinum]
MVSCFLQARPKCPDVGSRGGLRALLLLLLPFFAIAGSEQTRAGRQGSSQAGCSERGATNGPKGLKACDSKAPDDAVQLETAWGLAAAR